MIDSLVHFTEMKEAGYGRSGRALKVLCARFEVPVIKLSKRQYALRQSDYETLLSRATLAVASAD